MSGIQNLEALYISRICRHSPPSGSRIFPSPQKQIPHPFSTPIFCHSCFPWRLTVSNVLSNLFRFVFYGPVSQSESFGVWLLSLALILPRFIDIGILLRAKDTSKWYIQLLKPFQVLLSIQHHPLVFGWPALGMCTLDWFSGLARLWGGHVDQEVVARDTAWKTQIVAHR